MSDFSLIPALQISASGLNAEGRRMEVIANNVANAQTTRGEDGKVFRRKEVVFAARLASELGAGNQADSELKGVEIKGIVDDQRPLKRIFRPGHPDADKEGYVALPNINPVEEMVDMMSASRAYEANLAAMKSSRTMASAAIDILK
ncbi:MAG TPA: flagellar basal body rod protein FlgC [Verrucomicrobia bacterium]|nr:MAG: flagellar basal body rod protein FlgC [Lentisphaerae bacterium GWF2_57_35]HBA84868.1 flagellar basal body rod protein FlgC [Verrucomicrobiota bacterium]